MNPGLVRQDTVASTAESETSAQVRYCPTDQKADLRRGRLDGRRRTPSYTQVSDRIMADGSFTTAYSEELQELGRAAMRDEVDAYKRQVAPKRSRIAGLRELLATIGEEIERTRKTLRETAGELTPEELFPRSPVEALRGTELVQSRRWWARNRLGLKTRARLDALTGKADNLRRQIAELHEEMGQDLQRAKVRVDLQAAHTDLRVATYWRAVTETHREGRQLTVVVPRVRHIYPVWSDEPVAENTSYEIPDEE